MIIRTIGEFITTVIFCVTLALLAALITGCSFKIEAGWHGETGVSDTVVSKEFVETKKPITDRRY